MRSYTPPRVIGSQRSAMRSTCPTFRRFRLRYSFSPTPHPFLPYVAPHFSHISHFIILNRGVGKSCEKVVITTWGDGHCDPVFIRVGIGVNETGRDFFFLGASESMSWTRLDEGFGINEEARA